MSPAQFNSAGPEAAKIAHVALGSNLASPVGGPAATVEAAMERLSGLGVVAARSSLYETEAVGEVDQPAFVNAVVTLRTLLDPHSLLQGLLRLEREFGRDRGVTAPKGPRTLDLDILLMGELVQIGRAHV